MSKYHKPSDDEFNRDASRDASCDRSVDEETDAHALADQERFASDIAYCPECGAAVHDSADVCSKCFTWIDGATTSSPSARRARTHLRHIVIWILIGALALSAGVFGFLRLQL